MNEFKNLLESKTFWGAAVAGVASLIASATHHTVSPADQQTAVQALLDVINVVGQCAAPIGALYAIYGRVVASKKIGGM